MTTGVPVAYRYLRLVCLTALAAWIAWLVIGR